MRGRRITWFNRCGQVLRLSHIGYHRSIGRFCGGQARCLRLGGDRQVDVVRYRFCDVCRALERGAHPPAKLRAVDLSLCFDGEAGLRELLFGPHGFGHRTHLGSLHGDRGFGF